MLITFLVSCATSTTPAAEAKGSSGAVSAIDLEENDPGVYTAPFDEPVPVIVACEMENGLVYYGPTEEIGVSWREGRLYITAGVTKGYVDCQAWRLR